MLSKQPPILAVNKGSKSDEVKPVVLKTEKEQQTSTDSQKQGRVQKDQKKGNAQVKNSKASQKVSSRKRGDKFNGLQGKDDRVPDTSSPPEPVVPPEQLKDGANAKGMSR